MHYILKPFPIFAAILLSVPVVEIGAKDVKKESLTKGEGPPVLWRNPSDIASRDLVQGPGGKSHEPKGPFTFQKEVMQGSSPKFEIVDGAGVRWRVKLGPEARAEIAASRLVWAAGYFANENYFVTELPVQNLPQLNRGGGHIRNNAAQNVRLKRYPDSEKKLGSWEWRRNPFAGTREWYGLQILMALVNNWDVKDANNSVYQVREPQLEQRYVVSDLGGSFGPTGLSWTKKGDVASYVSSDWMGKVSGDSVDFAVPSSPSAGWFLVVPQMVRRSGLKWIGRDIPVTEVRWMGKLLAQLSPKQIRDAFRGAGYSAEEVEQLSKVVEGRIAELNRL